MQHARIAWWAGISLACLSCQVGFAQPKDQLQQQRQKLVDDLLVPAGISDSRVAQSMRNTPRHEFLPIELRSKAYLDMSLPIGQQQTISSPLIVAQMTQALKPQATDKVLEIGTGSGYQAAVLSKLVKDVYSIEIVEPLGKKAKAALDRLGYKNVHTKLGDGYLGWPENAPFNKIIVTCSPEKVPQPLVDQLAEGGIMVVPVGERHSQTLYLFTKQGGKLKEEALLPTLFVPMTGKAEQLRETKPDPTNPQLINGSFEEEPRFTSEGAQPGWFYERLVTRRTDTKSPDGGHYVEFKNTEPNLDGHLMQGFELDGRQVAELEVSGWVKTENVVGGQHSDQSPYIVLTIYDEQRHQLDHLLIGPFRGTNGWHEVRKSFRIPKGTREGLCRIGLFGATGMAAFDDLKVRKVRSP